MAAAMANHDPILLSLFTASWTVGMAAMMLPAISPMVLLYNKLTVGNAGSNAQALPQQQEKRPLFSPRTILFVASYLLVWALAGVALLLGWSIVMNNTVVTIGANAQLGVIYGAILIISGFYQFSPIKSKCLGYCESPMSFFMRRWSNGSSGAIKMGMYHGLYCLGCCWPYFLMMVALGWMNVLWMGLFATIIFGEKMWLKGIWVARAAGLAFIAGGILAVAGIIPADSLAGNIAMVPDDNGMNDNAAMTG
jgi:predicted metal-binding membrane protein